MGKSSSFLSLPDSQGSLNHTYHFYYNYIYRIQSHFSSFVPVGFGVHNLHLLNASQCILPSICNWAWSCWRLDLLWKDTMFPLILSSSQANVSCLQVTCEVFLGGRRRKTRRSLKKPDQIQGAKGTDTF